MRFNTPTYADFKATTNVFPTPLVLYTAFAGTVNSAVSVVQAGVTQVLATNFTTTTTEATLLADFPTAVKVTNISVT